MKSSYKALVAVCLAIAGLWYVAGGASSPSASAAEELRVSSPVAHENLTVFFIQGPDTVHNAQIMTLQEGIESGRAIVRETGNVNNLTAENLSPDYELFIQQGDIIRGGRQDRIIATDMLLPPKSGQVSFPCNCVEHGRWTGRGNEAATHFNKSDQFAVGTKLMCANVNLQQSVVWNSVAEQQQLIGEATKVNVNSPVSASSLQLTLENPVVQARIAEYQEALKARGESGQNVIGVVFLVNGEVTCAEVYGSNALFQKAWPKLLRSAATEALVEKKDRPLPPAPSAREMERYLAVNSKAETLVASNGHSEALRASGQPQSRVNSEAAINLEENISRVVPIQRELNSRIPAASNINGPQRGGRVIIEGNEANTDQLMLPSVDLQRGQVITASNNATPGGFPQPEYASSVRMINPGTPPQPVNPSANQLNVCLVENPVGLVTESRDSTRQNAVIHKSFIKKANNPAETPAQTGR